MKRYLYPVLILASGILWISPLATPAAWGAEGMYFGAQVGATILSDADLEQGGFTAEASYDTGFNVGAALGYKFNAARVEGEITYRTNDFDEISVAGIGVPVDGDLTALSLMVNAYYDINTGSAFTPYVGAGIGFAFVSVNDLAIGGFVGADDDDSVFAYQVGAGIGYAVNPAVTLDFNYRYFATSDLSLEDVASVPFDLEYASHNLSIGVRYSF